MDVAYMAFLNQADSFWLEHVVRVLRLSCLKSGCRPKVCSAAWELFLGTFACVSASD